MPRSIGTSDILASALISVRRWCHKFSQNGHVRARSWIASRF